MNKIICDICGTTYPSSTECCPICGCSNAATAELLGAEMPYEDFVEEFGRFINGNYVFESEPNEKGVTYTCELYCSYSSQEHIDVRTTAITIMDSVARLILKPNSAASIYVDTNSHVDIIVPAGSSCRVYLFGNGSARAVGCTSKVKIINMNEEKNQFLEEIMTSFINAWFVMLTNTLSQVNEEPGIEIVEE